ncbi:MAG TPA: hypothetical protein VL947_12375, partial [Cytophagales bacterium]|nr:hypothetical protein [Cytophagales bacterium]
AYDDYSLRAFKTNGIDYLLKQLNEAELEQSLCKCEVLQKTLSNYAPNVLYQALQQITASQRSYKRNFWCRIERNLYLHQ